EVARQREALHQSEKLNALGNLLAGVAHELNNPLSVVVGRANLLQEQVRDDKTRNSVEKIAQAAQRCARIVKTFLAMARRQSPTRAPTRVEDVIRSTLDVVVYGLQASGIRVETDFAEQTPEIMADADQLAQVFTNIVLNAQHALCQTVAQRRIRITTRHDAFADAVVVAIADDGPGIPEDLRPRIFEPFFTTKPTGVGTGIGLSVCRGIVESHGGTIEAGAADLGGAEFVVRLPILSQEASSDAENDTPPNNGNGRHSRVLVVDDEAEVGAMIRDILVRDGHQVETTTSANAALEMLKAHRFDVVISDIVMPELSGPALHDRIRSGDAPQPRIVFITGDSMGSVGPDFLEDGPHRVIKKPFSVEEIRAAVSS
ncbi:MAG: response regulator, partial [Alphaproteobacteria bacterium]|nr:response regulator [Alphaproteobacteria bacterium]